MCKAAAQNTAEGNTDFLVGGVRLSVEYSLCGEDHPTYAKSALRRPFVNKGLLDGMRFLGRSYPFEGGDFRLAHRLYRHHARPYGLAPHDDRATPALCHSAAKSWAPQPQLIGKNEQKRRFRIDGHGVAIAIYFQRNLAHENDMAASTVHYAVARY
jgi:hypothetical protein